LSLFIQTKDGRENGEKNGTRRTDSGERKEQDNKYKHNVTI
jgi:hypothetical protein